MQSLWRSSLETIRRRFEAASGFSPVNCELQHFGIGVVPNESELPWCHPERSDEASRSYHYGTYAPVTAMPPNVCLRMMRFQGEPPTKESLDRLIIDAGRCLRSVPQDVTNRLPLASLFADRDRDLWIWSLFDLAWARIAGSPLIAEKQLFWRGVFLPYDCAQMKAFLVIGTWNPGPPAELIEWADKLPDRFFSALPDVAAASIHAIDILLATVDESAEKRRGNALTDQLCKTQAPMTEGQKQVWDALKGRAMTAGQLVVFLKKQKVETSEDAVRQHILELRKAGNSVPNRPGRGYYRPDAPPPDLD